MTIDSARDRLHIGVLGPGGVGGLLTALLGQAGHEVTVVANPSTSEIIARRGLSVHSAMFGALAGHPRSVSTLGEGVDILFIATKAIGLEQALERIDREVMDTALVVPLLNGIEHMDLLRSWFPGITLSAAAIQVEATRTEPGVVEHHSPFVRVNLAPGDDQERTRRCAEILEDAGVTTALGAGESDVLWSKFCFLAPLALLTTYHRAPAGVVRKEHREDLLALSEEVHAVAERDNARLDPAAALGFFDNVPPEMRSSMQKDAEAGRTTELEAIGGALLRRAERHGVAVPVATRYVTRLRDQLHTP